MLVENYGREIQRFKIQDSTFSHNSENSKMFNLAFLTINHHLQA